MSKGEKELLILAAKAVGYEFIEFFVPKHGNGQLSAAWGGSWAEVKKPEAPLGNCRWAPHKDDGDAFRLATKLDLIVMPYPEDEAVRVTRLDQPETIVYWRDCKDKNAASRLAILRAAAQIGSVYNLPHFKPFDDADLITVEEFFSEGGMQCFTGDDGTGYFACSQGISDVSCFSDTPSWATHIAWYNK